MANEAAEKDVQVEEPEIIDETEEQPELKVVEKPNPITQSRFQLDVEANTRFRATVPEGVTPEDCMDESFWAHLGMRMMIGDTLIVRPDTGEWELVLHVANCGREFAHVVKKDLFDLRHDGSAKSEQSRYSVDFAGSTHKWRFKRDGEVLKDGFATKGLAQQAAKNHQMAVDRSVKH
jgi:hypothetical protein